MNGDQASTSLRIVPREKAFYFFTSIGNYTGESAASLEDFSGKIGKVDLKSLEFHMCRGDFEKWIADVLEDLELASEFRRLQQSDLSGDLLRNRLHSTVVKRLQILADEHALT